MKPTAALQILINQLPVTLAAGATLADAVTVAQIQPPFAAAINLQFVPKTRYDQTELHEGDRIDLIAPVVGG